MSSLPPSNSVIPTQTTSPTEKGLHPQLDSVSWLGDVREVRHPIDQHHPLFVRDDRMASGAVLEPSVPYPEQHPHCELNYGFAGTGIQFIGNEKIERHPGAVMLVGPGTPHYALRQTYPQRTGTVHFLPILLFEMGPGNDGARTLARFTAPQKITERVVQPPPAVGKKIARCFEEMLMEVEKPQIGSEFRLRALLMESLVELLRWEDSVGNSAHHDFSSPNWLHVEKALRFIHDHHADPIYVDEIARAAGLSVCGLQTVFRDALGMSCVQYLRSYRISKAAALLCNHEARVTEVALSVGFETLSHFNTSFRNLMGMSPTEYMRSRQ